MQYLFISHFHSHLKFKRNHVATKESKVLVDRPTFFFYNKCSSQGEKSGLRSQASYFNRLKVKNLIMMHKMIPTLYRISRLFQVSENLRKQGKFIAFFNLRQYFFLLFKRFLTANNTEYMYEFCVLNTLQCKSELEKGKN